MPPAPQNRSNTLGFRSGPRDPDACWSPEKLKRVSGSGIEPRFGRYVGDPPVLGVAVGLQVLNGPQGRPEAFWGPEPRTALLGLLHDVAVRHAVTGCVCHAEAGRLAVRLGLRRQPHDADPEKRVSHGAAEHPDLAQRGVPVLAGEVVQRGYFRRINHGAPPRSRHSPSGTGTRHSVRRWPLLTRTANLVEESTAGPFRI